jgi:transposase
MLKLPSLGELDQGMAVRIYLCVQPTDMRRGFDTLAASVKEFLRHDPFSGNLFLFVGRGKDRMKILYWDKDGFCLWYKRLEEGTFKLPSSKDAPVSVELKATELAMAQCAQTLQLLYRLMLLEGIDLKSIKRSKRFHRQEVSAGAMPVSV